MNVIELLKSKGVGFQEIIHPETPDMQRMAESIHVHGRDVAKTVLLRANGDYRYVLAILPAPLVVDMDKIAAVLGGSKMSLATESDVAGCCPDCECGALPPFGSQYNLLTVVDQSLANQEDIYFEGNTHQQTIRMKFEDFHRLESPLIASFAVRTDEHVPHTRAARGTHNVSAYSESGCSTPNCGEQHTPDVYRGFRS